MTNVLRLYSVTVVACVAANIKQAGPVYVIRITLVYGLNSISGDARPNWPFGKNS